MIPERLERRSHLSRVCAALSEEFAERLDAATIERVAADELAAYDGARIREFIPIMATRRARARLRQPALGQAPRTDQRTVVTSRGGQFGGAAADGQMEQEPGREA
jgi:Protein-tyrosine-phosphatase-like, N-terminal domain